MFFLLNLSKKNLVQGYIYLFFLLQGMGSYAREVHSFLIELHFLPFYYYYYYYLLLLLLLLLLCVLCGMCVCMCPCVYM